MRPIGGLPLGPIGELLGRRLVLLRLLRGLSMGGEFTGSVMTLVAPVQ